MLIGWDDDGDCLLVCIWVMVLINCFYVVLVRFRIGDVIVCICCR